jgi:hypothetical protein
MRPASPRDWLLAATGLALGLVIAAIDSRPTWDDTGVTVGLLVVAAAAVAFVDRRRPWLWAVLVGAPLAMIEVPTTGSLAPLAGLAFAAVGAAVGWLLTRAIGTRTA